MKFIGSEWELGFVGESGELHSAQLNWNELRK